MNGMLHVVLPLTISAAYQIGLQCLTTGMRRAVAACVPVRPFLAVPPQLTFSALGFL